MSSIGRSFQPVRDPVAVNECFSEQSNFLIFSVLSIGFGTVTRRLTANDPEKSAARRDGVRSCLLLETQPLRPHHGAIHHGAEAAWLLIVYVPRATAFFLRYQILLGRGAFVTLAVAKDTIVPDATQPQQPYDLPKPPDGDEAPTNPAPADA